MTAVIETLRENLRADDPVHIRRTPVKILAVQSWDDERFHDVLAAIRSRWADAFVTALVDEARVMEAGVKGEVVEVWTYARDHRARPVFTGDLRRRLRARRFDIYLLPFNDRFGVRYWRFRVLPLLTGIPRVVTLNGRQVVHSYGRSAWALNTIFACAVLRLAEVRVPKPVRDATAVSCDYLMIGVLALLAMVAGALRRAGLHPGLRRRRRSPRPVLCIFIPLLGLGGAQKALINVLRRLDHEQYTIRIWTLDAVFKFFEPDVRRLGIAVNYLPCAYGFPYWRIIWVLTKQLHREAPDAVVGWLPWATVFASIAGSMAGVPRIVTSLHSGSPARRQTAPLRWQRPLDILMGYTADVVLACSHACREDYMAWAHIPPGKIVTVYNGVDGTELRPPSDAVRWNVRSEFGLQDKRVVGIVARLSAEKDHATFFDALTMIRDAVPSVHALVIGDGNDREKLIAYVERCGLSNCVTFLGARSDAVSLLGALDVLALTSRTEGFPVVLLEAQAVGVPVVTTDAGGARETVRDGITGYVVPCGDSAGLADRIVQLLRDEPLRRRMGEVGRSHVLSRFNIDRMVAELLRHCRLESHPESVPCQKHTGLVER